MTQGPGKNIPTDESAFHDAWALQTPVEEVLVYEAFEGIAAQENRFAMRLIQRHLGGLAGKKVLDVGPGLGESSVYFLIKGAEVTALDISPEMVASCASLARHHGVEGRLKTVVGTVEGLDLPDGSFDLVFAANVLHHTPDIESALKKLKSMLRPGGMFISWDPVAYNPVINVYRRMATEVRSAGERPFTYREFRTIRKVFPDVRHREFWFFTLALFLMYYLVDRKNPNECRYWKEILRETERTIGWWFRPLLLFDSIILRIPLVRMLAWNTVCWGFR